MKALAILLAAACLIGTSLAALLCWFLATGPFENATPDNTRPFYELLLPIAVAFVFAALTLGAVAVDHRKAAVAAFALHVVATGFALVRALGVSDHSDGVVVVFALAIEVAGLSAVLLGRRTRPIA